ncbi:MAG: glycine cleavage system aminomethyltransferase GcvT [Planctomycetota bacterium]
MSLLHTPFRKFHEEAGGKLVDFAGWEMPLHYGSILDEHLQTRASGSIFDVSHMGRFKISGGDARVFLETVLTRKVTAMKPGMCRYALVCNERGGVKDDVLVYRYPKEWMLVVNASNRLKLLEHFGKIEADRGFKIKLEDVTEKTAMLAVQGPNVMAKIAEFSKEIPALKNYGFIEKSMMFLKMTVSRTGYTGEDGVEVVLGANTAGMVMKMLMKEKDDTGQIKPAGLGARDSLRLEAGMPLYGHELDEDTDPLSAGLSFAVSLDKHVAPEDGGGEEVPRFIGQDALEGIRDAGVPKTLVGLKLGGKRTPRQGAAVSVGGAEVGGVTSGCLSPTLGVPIAMAYVAPGSAGIGDAVDVAVGSKTAAAEVVALPFYKRAR